MPSFNSWSDIEKHLADAGNHEKGELFEQLSEHLLTWDPKYQTLLKHVWRLKGTPTQVLSKLNIPQQDQGIDLIAETFDGKYWAIQCKYHGDADKNVTHREISTFLALSNTIASNISFCLVITTADDYARLYKGQSNMGFVLSNVWAELPETFYTDFGKKDKPAINTPRQPRKHQQKAIAEAVQHFKDERRGKLIFPCGAGKSLTGYWISKALDAKHILVAVPSLALVKQTLDDYCRESLAEGNPIAPFCICSDEGIGKSDDVAIFSQDLGINCTTDREQIKEFLGQKTERKKVIFTTYQSGRVLGEAIKEVAFSFDLGILDEAHKTVGAADKLFSYLLFDENVNIQKRIFMTATERRYKGSSDNILSMDDPEVYGDTFSQLSFKEAIDLEILSDYKIITLLITKEEVKEYLKQNDIVYGTGLGDNEEVDFRTYASLIALRKAMDKYPIKHAVTFHGSIKRAKLFSELQEPFEEVYPHFSKVSAYHVTGAIPTGIRSKIVREFAGAEKAIITNAKCLTEGVDVPNIDCVLFADPRNSTVDIVQAVGRALRRAGDKEFGYVLLPIYSEEKSGEALLESEDFQNILSTLRALASNDERIVEFFREKQNAKGKAGIRDLVQFDIEEIASGININTTDLIEQLELKAWSRLARLGFLNFNDAKQYVVAFNIKSYIEWREWSKKHRPFNIPGSPDQYYKDKGWVSWSDFLGFEDRRNAEKYTYEKAKEVIAHLGLQTSIDYQSYLKDGNAPVGLPGKPQYHYQNSGWKGWDDFLSKRAVAVVLDYEKAKSLVKGLGINTIKQYKYYRTHFQLQQLPANPPKIYEQKWIDWDDFFGIEKPVYLSFLEARQVVHGFKLGSKKSWDIYIKSENSVKNIPRNPEEFYSPDFIDWADWLGIEPGWKKSWRAFKEAKLFVQSLNLKNEDDWRKYIKSGNLPQDIPKSPSAVYSEWKGMGDWLGTGNVAPADRKFLSFEEAKKVVRDFNIQTQSELKEFILSENCPPDFPSNPNSTYKTHWKGLGDFLGTNTIAPRDMLFYTYQEARRIVLSHNVRNKEEYNELKRTNPLLPSNPANKYKEFKNWFDFLGKPEKEFYAFDELKVIVRQMGIKTQSAYKAFQREDPKAPSQPERVYKEEWKNYSDFLGTGKIANQDRKFFSFEEAASFVRQLNLRSQQDFYAWCRKGLRPPELPSNPQLAYKDKGWKGWSDFLGKN